MVRQGKRSENITRNVVVAVIAQMIIMLFSFVNRTIFIHLLGENYLGIDGLFGSLLTVFSLAELGIGNAIIFSLYKPIAMGDTKKARQYITLFEKAYTVIIITILLVGLSILPLIPAIVKTDGSELNINIYLVYLLYLINTVSTYFFAHRQTVLLINQRQSTISWYQMLTKVAVCVIECVTLILFSNYYLYLIVMVAGNYAQTLILNRKAKRNYPALCTKSHEKLSREELSIVKNNVYALFIRRVGSVILSSTDNIIINYFIALSMVGVYSNYILIVSSIQTMTTQMFSAMTATIGNFVAMEDNDSSEQIFKTYTFTTYIVYGFCSICLYVLTNRFVRLLWGTGYLLSKTALFFIVFNFFLYGFQSAINVFRDTTGLFVQGKYRSVYSAVINVVSSLILVKIMGIEGVILGTIVSRLLCSAWYDPYILYRKFFEKKVSSYYFRLVVYTGVAFTYAIVYDRILSRLPSNLGGFIICTVVCAFSVIPLLLPFLGSEEFKCLYQRVTRIIKR